jgi:UMF1 family MFS transporter
MYDFANNIFAMNVISLYFALWVTVDKGGADILYSLALAVSMTLSAVAAPVVGMLSDALHRKKLFLIVLTVVSVIFTGCIGFADRLLLGLLFFVIANFGYQVAAAVYNALLPQVAGGDAIGKVSGYGKAFGYGGALVGLFLVRPFVAAGGKSAAFIPTAVLFLLFSLPCFIFVKEKTHSVPFKEAQPGARNFFAMIQTSIGRIKGNKDLILFLIATFVVLNAINTIMVFMSVYATKVIGFSGQEINTFLIVSTFVAILGCFVFGVITDKAGAKRTLCYVIGLWCISLLLASLCRNKAMFWIIGPMAGIALGSTWVTSRALVIDLAPKDMVAQVFGLFGVASYVSAITGPLIWGLVVWKLDFMGLVKYRIALMVMLVFFVIGLTLLRKIPNRNAPQP